VALWLKTKAKTRVFGWPKENGLVKTLTINKKKGGNFGINPPRKNGGKTPLWGVKKNTDW